MTISQKRLKEIKSIKDKDIDYSDIPELDDAFWKKAILEQPKKKEQITIRIDDDVLRWFRDNKKHYQSSINSVLKSYVKVMQKKS